MSETTPIKSWTGVFAEFGNTAAFLLFVPQIFHLLLDTMGRAGLLIAFAILTILAMRSAWRTDPPTRSDVLGADGQRVLKRSDKFVWPRRILSTLSFLVVGSFLTWNTYAWYTTPALRVLNSEKIGLDSNALVGDETVAFAYIFDPKENSPVEFVSCAFVCRIDVVKDSSTPWANIDAIIAKVEQWQALPVYQPIAQALPHYANLYLVEVDKPDTHNSGSFRAKYLYEQVDNGSDVQEWVPLQIGDDKPRSIFVRVNAKTPGLYTIKIVAEVRTLDSAKEYIFCPLQRILFDKPETWEND